MYSDGQKKASLNFFKYLRNGRSGLYEIWNISAWQARGSQKFFWKRYVNICAHTTQKCAHTRQNVRTHIYVFTRNFMKMVIIVQNYVMALSFKFHKDLNFCCGDICKLMLNVHARCIYGYFLSKTAFQLTHVNLTMPLNMQLDVDFTPAHPNAHLIPAYPS